MLVLSGSPSWALGPAGWEITLDWTPQFCRENPGSKEVQCEQELYFVLGGLKPIFAGPAPDCVEDRLPEELMDDARLDVPNRTKLTRMWARDGACSGLSPADYVQQVSRASRRFVAPPELRRVPEGLRMSPQAMREAFTDVNADLAPSQLVPQCRRRSFSAVLICVDANFQPRDCGGSAERMCGEEFSVRGFTANQLRGVD